MRLNKSIKKTNTDEIFVIDLLEDFFKQPSYLSKI